MAPRKVIIMRKGSVTITKSYTHYICQTQQNGQKQLPGLNECKCSFHSSYIYSNQLPANVHITDKLLHPLLCLVYTDQAATQVMWTSNWKQVIWIMRTVTQALDQVHEPLARQIKWVEQHNSIQLMCFSRFPYHSNLHLNPGQAPYLLHVVMSIKCQRVVFQVCLSWLLFMF